MSVKITLSVTVGLLTLKNILAVIEHLAAGDACSLASGFDLQNGCMIRSPFESEILACESDTDRGPCYVETLYNSHVLNMRKVQSSKEYNAMLKASIGVEGGAYGQHAGVTASGMIQSGQNELSVSFYTGFANNMKQRKIRGFDKIRLTDTARGWLKACTARSCPFLDQYGPHYVAQIEFGRTFLGWTTVSQLQKSAVATSSILSSVTANDALHGDLNGNLNAALEIARNQSSLSFSVSTSWISRGGTANTSMPEATPDGLEKAYNEWMETSASAPVPMTITVSNWLDVDDISREVFALDSVVIQRFQTHTISSILTSELAEEKTKCAYVINLVNVMMNWGCYYEIEAFAHVVDSSMAEVKAKLVEIETADENHIISIQAKILSGDTSFNVASKNLRKLMKLEHRYSDACNTCPLHLTCGSSCCRDLNFPKCCPAYPGYSQKARCIPADASCCTDKFYCAKGWTCYPVLNYTKSGRKGHGTCCPKRKFPASFTIQGHDSKSMMDGSQYCCPSEADNAYVENSPRVWYTPQLTCAKVNNHGWIKKQWKATSGKTWKFDTKQSDTKMHRRQENESSAVTTIFM